MIATLESAIGDLWISGGNEAIDFVSWRPLDGIMHQGELDWILKGLDGYFQGNSCGLPGSLLFMGTGTLWVRYPRVTTPFMNAQKILVTIEQIPYGYTRSYSEVAAAAGNPGSARAVGSVCRFNPLPILIPCHRVVGHNSLGGYSPGIHLKENLLKLEGSLGSLQG